MTPPNRYGTMSSSRRGDALLRKASTSVRIRRRAPNRMCNSTYKTGGGLQVLIVEDDALVARALRRTLRREGASSLVATSVADASSVLERSEELSAVILDVQLPDGSGLALLEHRPRIPTMVLTGYPTQQAMRLAVARGALFMQKPAVPRDIASFLRWARGNQTALSALTRAVDALAEGLLLTDREQEVLMCAAQGMDRPESATFLGIKPTTLATHIRRIREKADANFGDVVRRVHRSVFSSDRDDHSV